MASNFNEWSFRTYYVKSGDHPFNSSTKFSKKLTFLLPDTHTCMHIEVLTHSLTYFLTYVLKTCYFYLMIIFV